MKCEEVESSMLDYLDKTLDKTQREEIDRHLITCERCMDEVKEFQSILREMDETEMEKPDETLRINFYHMLQTEINKQKAANKPLQRKQISLWASPWMKVAAGIALVIAGAFIGRIFQPGVKTESSSAQLGELKSEVTEMKKMLMFTMLNEESPSQRIKAVNYADDIPNPDQKVIGALLNTLNKDKNVNVRLAALYSLAKFTNSQQVRDSLVKSLEIQNEPIIQIALMNILTEKKEIKAVEPMRKIMSEKNVMKEVKETAKKGIEVLL
ncbi:MAG TPA: zf-HC2 domain-containing protein [Bacteroidales bacterium]